ncbi:hypothetical protein HMPREF9075_02571 [Capnocytophaga sp. oral taxon 332 str. F0381]|nr:hypothetical protein HMPREF9075_02571 [Capnocytophaga sp. oral taxon 332 str. F0381]
MIIFLFLVNLTAIVCLLSSYEGLLGIVTEQSICKIIVKM